jgi:hypothetical protein
LRIRCPYLEKRVLITPAENVRQAETSGTCRDTSFFPFFDSQPATTLTGRHQQNANQNNPRPHLRIDISFLLSNLLYDAPPFFHQTNRRIRLYLPLYNKR